MGCKSRHGFVVKYFWRKGNIRFGTWSKTWFETWVANAAKKLFEIKLKEDVTVFINEVDGFFDEYEKQGPMVPNIDP